MDYKAKLIEELIAIIDAIAPDLVRVESVPCPSCSSDGSLQLGLFDCSDCHGSGKKEITTVIPTEEIEQKKNKAIQSIVQKKDGIEIKFYDKLRAIDLLAKITGVYDAKQVANEIKIIGGFKNGI